MQPEEVKQLLANHFSGCDVEVSGDGRHFDIRVVGDVFEGLNAVKKQQLVYAALSEQIADGTVHAVNMKTFTCVEWQQQNV
jgi:acid stress-induced BolA-like protein IbaG/YrbA